MIIRNKELRQAKGKIPTWLIAEKLGIHENTLFRRFRREMNKCDKKEILDAIKEINIEMSKERNEDSSE